MQDERIGRETHKRENLKFDLYDSRIAGRVSFRARKTGRIEASWMTKQRMHFARRPPRGDLTLETMPLARTAERYNDLERRTVIERPRHIVKNIRPMLLPARFTS